MVALRHTLGGGVGNIAAKRADREKRERAAAERAASDKAERRARKAEKEAAAAMASVQQRAALDAAAASRAAAASSRGGGGGGRSRNNVSRPPEVGGFGGIDMNGGGRGMDGGMGGAPPQRAPPGVRGGGMTGFGNPALQHHAPPIGGGLGGYGDMGGRNDGVYSHHIYIIPPHLLVAFFSRPLVLHCLLTVRNHTCTPQSFFFLFF